MYLSIQPLINRMFKFLIFLLSLHPGVEFLYAHVVVAEFFDNSTLRFNKLATEDRDDSIFIGAVNRLYHLSSDLELLANVTTGPLPINSTLEKQDHAANLTHKLIDNFNKILLVDNYEKRLVTCGTVPFCTIYNITTSTRLSESEATKVFKSVLTNRENASAVAFSSRRYMWIAQSHGSNFLEKSEVPSIALRNAYSLELIDYERLFDKGYHHKHTVNYIYGFPANGGNYFLTTQRNSTGQSSPYISKLIRVCDRNDENPLNGYVEIPIECTAKGERPYNLVQAACIAHPDVDLAASMNITTADKVLFAVFSQSHDSNAQKPHNRSALCMYSLKAINRKFYENIQYCIDGYGSSGLEFILPERQFDKKNITSDWNSCLSNMNMSIGGKIPITMSPVKTFNTHLTAIAARSSEYQTDIFISTSAGLLKKIIVKNSTSACDHGDITIDEQSSVNADLQVTPNRKYVLVMTDHKLTKVDALTLHLDCSIFTTYDDCVRSNTSCNYWCSSTDECTSRCGCHIRELHWRYHYDIVKDIEIYSYHPKCLQLGISNTIQLQLSEVDFKKTLDLKDALRCVFAIENLNFTCIINITSDTKTDTDYSIACKLPLSLPPLTQGSMTALMSIAGAEKNLFTSAPTIWSTYIKLFDKPEFNNFSIQFVEPTGKEFIVIKGNNMNESCNILDIQVEAGNHNCKIISLSSDKIICSLFEASSLSSLYDDNDQAHVNLTRYKSVTVTIGEHFRTLVPHVDDVAKASSNNSSLNLIIYITVSVIFFFIVIVLFKIYLNYLQTLKKMQRRVNQMGMDAIAMRQCMKRVIIENHIHLDGHSANILNLPNVAIEVTTFERATTRSVVSEIEYLLPLDDKWEFNRHNLTLGRFLGEGEFGKVLQGEAAGISEVNDTITVAVKMLKDTHSDADMIDLVSEMEIMKLIGNHVNVLRLLGCCTQNGPLFIITEFAPHGNLLDFLRKRNPFAVDKIISDSLSEQSLLKFALQVARGMEHLASIKCIHRDLAARNILVSDDYVMKIADFGLAKDIQNKEYYKVKTNGRLPVKWMAPEALSHLLFTTQSDMWSYGVLLWEIFTFGAVPYSTCTDMDKLIVDLQSGYRLRQPPNCSLTTYNVMCKCWRYLPEERPTFSLIVKELRELLEIQGEAILSEHASVHSNYGSSCSEFSSTDPESETDQLLA